MFGNRDKQREEEMKLVCFKSWEEKILYLQFPDSWQIQFRPSLRGEFARFRIKQSQNVVSVYLDVANSIGGSPDEPYWEVHNFQTNEFRRYKLNETDKVLNGIKEDLCN